jgi:hypothetical protein
MVSCAIAPINGIAGYSVDLGATAKTLGVPSKLL